MRVDCIRVTHPYATLGPILLRNLPFGLHVLGLPLAFILSQDQTLHSITPTFNIAAESGNPSIASQLSQKSLCHLTPGLHRFLSRLHLAMFPSLESTCVIPLSVLHRSAINLHLFNELLTPPVPLHLPAYLVLQSLLGSNRFGTVV